MRGHSEDQAADCSADIEAIQKVIERFFEGIRRLDAELITSIFHPKASSYSVTPRGVCIEPTEAWRKIIGQAKDDPAHLFRQEFSGRILTVKVVGTAAGAEVEWTFDTARIVDFYNLLKVEGKWLIVNQVYHTFAEEGAR